MELPWEQTIQHVNTMTMRMQYSGYNKKFRHEVVSSALKAYKVMLMKDQAGEKPMYRPKEWMRKEREQQKHLKKKTWYKKGGDDSVIFVPATPNSALKKSLEKDVKDSGIKIKIVEKSGESIKRMLQRSDPFKVKTCNKDDCIVCQTGGKGPCRTTNATYKIKCTECNQVYIGETARNTYTRGKEHLREMDSKKEGSVLWKHAKEKHQGTVPNYTCNVTHLFQRDALLRQVSEAVQINKVRPEMNTKNEWNYINIPRATIN